MTEIASSVDLLVYIVPGYVVFLAAAYTWLPKRLGVTQDRLGAGEVVASVICALLLGIIVHQVATFTRNAVDGIFLWPTYSSAVRGFEHIEHVRTKLAKILGFMPAGVEDCYFYGRVLIAEKAPHVAESADRLLRLANVCQNMLFAAPAAALILAFGRRESTRRSTIRIVLPIAAAALLDIVFFYGMMTYWTAAIYRVLRATLLLTVT